MTEWIKCSDRLPPLNTKVLVLENSTDIDFGTRMFEDDDMFFVCHSTSYDVTHWAELPQPPEEDS